MLKGCTPIEKNLERLKKGEKNICGSEPKLISLRYKIKRTMIEITLR